MISGDTNLFVYAADPRDAIKHAIARSVVQAMGRSPSAVGLQVVGELQNVLRRRLRAPSWRAYQFARNVLIQFPAFAYDERAVELALDEAISGRLSYWDGLLLAAADAAGVKTMISEDMGDGRVFRGLEVVNPFGPDGPSDRVRQLLGL
jgi:predicted nucleic acid-binding protein